MRRIKMTKEEIEELKQKIKDGWQMAHDPMCSEGFEAAIELINYYEKELSRYMRIAAVYEDFYIISSKIKAEANKK
jgi:hypothetical protein